MSSDNEREVLSENKDLSPNKIRREIPFPQYYANALAVGLSLTDIQITASVNGNPIVQLILPLAASKSLVDSLNKAIKDYETKLNTQVLDLQSTIELMNKK